MSNLRRMVLADRFFFITCRVYRPRRKLSEAELAVLAEVVRERREAHRFLRGNPVKAGLVKRPEDWPWSSVHDYTGTVNAPSGKGSSIPVERILTPSDEEIKEPQSFKKRNSALPAWRNLLIR